MSSLKTPAAAPPAGDKHAPAAGVQSTMVILPLGGGQEVGRSCILLQYHGRSILLDCGIHPGREGMDACPFFDIIEPSEIDFVLITHFHLDHCASLPYFTEKTDFKGRVFMTHATKAVMRLLISDYIKLQFSGSRHSGNALYDDEDLLNCINKCETVNFHQTMNCKGVKFTPSCAGHVLGMRVFLCPVFRVPMSAPCSLFSLRGGHLHHRHRRSRGGVHRRLQHGGGQVSAYGVLCCLSIAADTPPDPADICQPPRSPCWRTARTC